MLRRIHKPMMEVRPRPAAWVHAWAGSQHASIKNAGFSFAFPWALPSLRPRRHTAASQPSVPCWCRCGEGSTHHMVLDALNANFAALGRAVTLAVTRGGARCMSAIDLLGVACLLAPIHLPTSARLVLRCPSPQCGVPPFQAASPLPHWAWPPCTAPVPPHAQCGLLGGAGVCSCVGLLLGCSWAPYCLGLLGASTRDQQTSYFLQLCLEGASHTAIHVRLVCRIHPAGPDHVCHLHGCAPHRVG